MNTLPAEFIAHFQRLFLLCESVACARRALLNDWQTGHAIPGYGARADWFARQPASARENAIARALIANSKQVLPPGWSAKNLARFVPTKAERRCPLPATNLCTRPGVAAQPWSKGSIETAFRACAAGGL